MISLATTQQVPVVYEEAGLLKRIYAFTVDGVIVGTVYLCLLLVLIPTVGYNIFESGLSMRFMFWLLPMGGTILYHFLWEVFQNGQSPGKRLVGIRVIRLNGQEVQIYEYLLRAVLHLLETVLSFGSVAILMIAFTKRHQRLGDLVAHTVVVLTPRRQSYTLEDVERIQALSPTEHSFQNLSQFNDQEMVLVKQLLQRQQIYRNEAHRKLLRQVADALAEKLKMDPPEDAGSFLREVLSAYIAQTR